MNVATLTLGPLATNCYLVWAEPRSSPAGQPTAEGGTSALLVDCAGDAKEILRAAEQRGLDIRFIINTHGHTDHIEALAGLKEITGAEVAIHELDAPMLADPMQSGAAMWGFAQDAVSAEQLLVEGDTISLDGVDLRLSVLHTPGHTPGSICLLGGGLLFSGDCLFAGGIGRVDLPGGDERAMMRSLGRVSQLDPALTVYPGHGPSTTIGEELKSNPWLANL